MVESAKRRKFTFHHHKHANYERVLEAIRVRYEKESEPEYLAVPYILMCATTLEARLNDELFGFASATWKDDFKAVAEAYLSMSFRGKLNALVPVLTNNEYRINHDHFVYQRLASLISVRNVLAHPKPSVGEFEDASEDGPTWPFPYPLMPKELTDTMSDLTMGATKTFSPLEYHEAIEKLEKWFFRRCPDRLAKVAIVVARK
jgi:hypothetical protein